MIDITEINSTHSPDEVRESILYFINTNGKKQYAAFADVPKKQIQKVCNNFNIEILPDIEIKEENRLTREEKFIKACSEIDKYFSEQKIEIRKNIHSKIYEFKYEVGGWVGLDNDDISTFFIRLKRKGVNISKLDFLDYLRSKDIVKQYDPVSELFSNKWDGKNWIDDLLNTITLINEKDRKWFINIFVKWIVGFVSCIQGNSINDIALIFTGRQGTGKTTFFEAICKRSKYLHGLYKTTNSIFTSNKDSEFLITQFALIILDELDVITINQINSLKSNFSKTMVSNRPAYGHILESRKRIATFCGSSNNERLLSDETGNRRFLVFPIREIKNVFENEINYDQVLLQAEFIRQNWLKQGITHFLTKEEIKYNEKYSNKFMCESLEEQSISDILICSDEFKESDDGVVFMPTEEIALKCWQSLGIGGVPLLKKYSRILKKRGYVSKTKRYNNILRRGFIVKFKLIQVSLDESFYIKDI